MSEDVFSTHAVCKMVGVSYRQLDYWDRAGIISPAQKARGSGTKRRYTASDVRRVLIIKQLMVGGAREKWSERLRKVVQQLPSEIPDMRWLVVGTTKGAGLATEKSLSAACVKYGPGCIVIDLEPSASKARAS